MFCPWGNAGKQALSPAHTPGGWCQGDIFTTRAVEVVNVVRAEYFTHPVVAGLYYLNFSSNSLACPVHPWGESAGLFNRSVSKSRAPGVAVKFPGFGVFK